MVDTVAAASGQQARTVAQVDADLRELRLEMACPGRWAEYAELRYVALHRRLDALLDEREALGA